MGSAQRDKEAIPMPKLRVHLPGLQTLAKSDSVLSLEYPQVVLRDFPKHPYVFCTQRHTMTKSMRQPAFLLVFTNEVLVPIFTFRAYPKKATCLKMVSVYAQ